MPATATGLPVNGVKLHYEEHGAGAPILCIHGAGSSARLWADAVEKLSRLGRVIAYDRRGYARSERPVPHDRVDVAQHADDAAALLDALQATPAVVIGRSYGGEVATSLALRHPGKLRALILLEGAPVALSAAAERWTVALRDRLHQVAERRGVEAVGEAVIAEVLGDGAWHALPDVVRSTFTENGAGILADLHGNWLRADAAALATIRAPVLLVAAHDSLPELREPNDPTARALPDARTAEVDGGHLIDPAAPVVMAFIEDVLGGR